MTSSQQKLIPHKDNFKCCLHKKLLNEVNSQKKPDRNV